MAESSTEQTTAQAIELLKALVGFKSISHDTNLPLVDFIEKHLTRYSIKCTRIPSPEGKKSNLLARIGPEAEGGIILSGHTDVVPVEGQEWDTDPFVLSEKNGKLYGRGTSDMKSFLAVCLAFAPQFAKLKLVKPLYFAFSYDEEIGCLGVPHLLSHLREHAPKPAFALIGEPTEMKVVTAHKGVLSFETTVYGKEWHSSQPQYGVNAVQVACELVHFLSEMGKDSAATGKKDQRFDPPHSTVHVGIIRGGTARNIIPKECCINWEIRPLPGDNPDMLIERFTDYCEEQNAHIHQKFPECGISTQPMSRMMGVTLPADAASHLQTVMRAAQTNQEHVVSFGTEAGVFHDYGIPAIVCGPGSIEQAHQPNEFIAIEQIRTCVEFMQRFYGLLPLAP